MIKSSMSTLSNLILKLFNHVLISEIFPEKWCEGYIIPIYKKGDTNLQSNYRGITIASTLGKLFTKLLNQRLHGYQADNHIIKSNQIGFTPHRRTSDHIFVLKTIVDTFKINKRPLFACFVDFKNAFDTIWRNGLLYKLYKIQVSSKFINIVASMYKNVKSCVKCNDGLTPDFPVQIGTRQGCNLSPTLFNIYVNDLIELLHDNCDLLDLGNTKLNSLMYADDLIVMARSEKGLQRCLNTNNSIVINGI